MKRLMVGLGCLALLANGLLVSAGDEPAKKTEKPQKAKVVRADADAKNGDQDAKAKAKKEQEEEQRWMELKLLRSQEIFAELTSGNLEGVAKRARAMQAADILEFWLRGREFQKKEEYQKQLEHYQSATKELARHAEKDDLDGATEAWVSLSRSCVSCHKLLRDGKKPVESKK